jgi:hypothetical protein
VHGLGEPRSGKAALASLTSPEGRHVVVGLANGMIAIARATP